jgi:arginase
LGIRDIDYDEKEHLINFGMKYYTCDHITRFGIGETVEKCIQYLGADKNPVHICFDINAVDPEYAPGTSTKCREGLDYREALYICRRLRSTLNLVGFDILEVNPDLDVNRNKYFGDNTHLRGK